MASNISQGFLDISFSFSRNPVTNDIFVLKNENAIQKSVINLVKTRLGERFFNSLIGSSIEDSLFEFNTSEIQVVIEEQIKNLFSNFEPRVFVKEVNVSSPDDSYDLNVTIRYDIVGLPVPTQTVDFILQPTRI